MSFASILHEGFYFESNPRLVFRRGGDGFLRATRLNDEIIAED